LLLRGDDDEGDRGDAQPERVARQPDAFEHRRPAASPSRQAQGRVQRELTELDETRHARLSPGVSRFGTAHFLSFDIRSSFSKYSSTAARNFGGTRLRSSSLLGGAGGP